VISAPLIAFLYVEAGWRLTFLIVGLLGLLWLVPWLIYSRRKRGQHPWLSEEERKHIEANTAPVAGSLNEKVYTWKELLRFRETWAVVLSRFFLDPVWWLFVNWLPIYLSEKFLFDVKAIGAFAWVPYVGAAAGSLLGGGFSSRLIRRKGRAVKARITAVTAGCIIMLPSLVLTAFATTPSVAIALITLILFGFQFAISNIQTLPSDFYDGRNVGTVTGMSGTAAVIGVLITTWLVPALTRHGYFWFFLLGALLVPLAYLSVVLLSPQPKQRQEKVSVSHV
jgi:ACS family hexuronate transporter-like MFS transporter